METIFKILIPVRCIFADSPECERAQIAFGRKCDHAEWHKKISCNEFACINMYRSKRCMTSDEAAEFNIDIKGW